MPAILLFITLLGTCFLPLLGQAAPPREPAAGELQASERWILERVAAGEIADLQERFGAPEEGRQVRAAFLARLLTGGYGQITIPYQGVRLSRAIITGTLDLENADIKAWVELIDCRLAGDVNLRDCSFQKGFTLSRCHLAGKLEAQRLRVALSLNLSETTFTGLLGQAAYFNQAVFWGPVNLTSGRVGDVAQFLGASFGQAVDFFGARFGSQLNIAQAQFAGPANFGYVSVEAQFVADGAQFQDRTAPANFNSLKVGHTAFFRGVSFAGPVQFISAAVGSEFHLDGAGFGGQLADFNNLKVAQHFLFRNTEFHGPVNFNGASIGGELVFIQTRFLASNQPAGIREVQVGATGYFWDSFWAGGLDLSGARLHKAVMGFAPERPGEIPQLTLEQVTIDRTWKLENARLGTLTARKLVVKDGAELSGVTILDRADLRGSSFGALMFQKTTWPKKPDALWLEGLTYQSLGGQGESQDWPALLKWVEQARYDTRNYGLLETYFKQGGYKDRADTVYIMGKRREARQQWWRPDNLATLFFWDLLAGYGRKPGRTFWLGLGIVMLGTLVFGEKNFDPAFIGSWNWLREGGPVKRWVFRFFLSLDQFLPGIDLGLAKLWTLSQVSYGELIYYHFHKLSGWILIPIGLAALYSQFR